jgi:tRNA modification GTPase
VSLRQHQDTIIAAATPSGKSALALVRVTGNDAITLVAKLLPDPAKLFAALGHSTIYTDLISDNDDIIDDVVIVVFRAPHSFTGEDLLEISSHGSPIIVQQIVDRLLSLGARQALPGEFSQRAFFSGKISLEQAELIDTKIASESIGELRGSEKAIQEKYQRIRALYDSLIAILAKVNAQIDFGESDDISFDDLDSDRQSANAQIEALIKQASIRSANAAHLSIALIGSPNVGKSSLFNALLQYERSIVSDTPGTTRDYLESFLPIEGFRVKLIDTAGLREAGESIEAKGIEFTHEVSRKADILVYLTDPDTRSASPKVADLIVHNKADLDGYASGISVSATTGHGLLNLHTRISELVKSRTAESSGISLSNSEISILRKMRDKLASIDSQSDLTLTAEELRSVIDSASELLGTNINEDTLNHIFLKMCIGK